MNVIVVGCGRVGSELAYRMYKKGNNVTVADISPAAFANLPPDFRGRTVEGDVLSADVLHRCGVEQADALAAVTTSDSLNAVVGHIARTVYGVGRVVARNYDSRRRSLIEAFDLQLISSGSWGAQRIEEMLSPLAAHTVFSAGNGEVEIYEAAVPARLHGVLVEQLNVDGECMIAAVTRAGRALLPRLDTALETGDLLTVSATQDGIAIFQQRLGGE